MIENVSEISLLSICSKLKHYVQIYKLWLVKAFIYDNRRGGRREVAGWFTVTNFVANLTISKAILL